MNQVHDLDAQGFSAPRLPLEEARQQLRGLLSGETDIIANAANTGAFLNTLLGDINWIGFYFIDGSLSGGSSASNTPVPGTASEAEPRGRELLLGPFQGNPACVRIPVGKGVCGTCVETGLTQRIADVHAFPGHIACDPRSRSELVVPLRDGARIVGVLDIDSPFPDRFSADDQDYVETLVHDFAELQFADAG